MTVATFQLVNYNYTTYSSTSNTRLKIRKTPPSSSRTYFPSKKLSASPEPVVMASSEAATDNKPLEIIHTASNTSSSSSSSSSSSPQQLSRPTSRSSTKSRPSLSIDIPNPPPLSQPTPPSNTLLITELRNPSLFEPATLVAIRELIESIAQTNSFNTLRGRQRIMCSFLSTEDAIKVRQHLERTTTVFNEYGVRPKIYFSEHTAIQGTEEAKRMMKLLEAPQSDKMFFISPPPSPPHGWVMRNEDPPNKEVHASDLAEALARLGTSASAPALSNNNDSVSPVSASSPLSDRESTSAVARTGSFLAGAGRSRSSTLIYHPSDHGGSPNLPAVMVEDTSVVDDDNDWDMMDLSPVDREPARKIFAHTARPPVELME